MTVESLLAAGRDAAGGECLWAGRPQAPGGHVLPTLSQMEGLTGLTPPPCFNERSRGLSALQGPALAVRKAVHGDSHCGPSGTCAPGVGHTPATQMFPEAAHILQGLYRPRDPASWEPLSSAALLDSLAHGAATARTETPLPRPRLRPGLEQQRALPGLYPPLCLGRLQSISSQGGCGPAGCYGRQCPRCWLVSPGLGVPLPAPRPPGSCTLPSLSAIQVLGSILCGPLSPAKDQDQAGCGLGMGISLRQFSRLWSGEFPTGPPVKTQHSQS